MSILFILGNLNRIYISYNVTQGDCKSYSKHGS